MGCRQFRGRHNLLLHAATSVIYGMMGTFLIAAIALVVAVLGCAFVAPSNQD
jgi:hypothetical protein